MPPFEKPDFRYDYSVSAQIKALWDYREGKPRRAIPSKSADRLLVATWNVANLGLQERREEDYRLIAELASWFDLITIQEVNENLGGLRAIKKHLPGEYRALFSDPGGNRERVAFLYDASKLELLEQVGEVAVPPSDHRHIKLPGIRQKFRGFDRNPYIGSFGAGSLELAPVSVHLYFGSESKRSLNRRSLEAYAVARWADLRRKSETAYARDIIVLGDFNLPKAVAGDPIYEALTKRGLCLPAHSSRIGSSIKSDRQYDQIAFFPGRTGERFTGKAGIFDFDGALFRTLWETRGPDDFITYMQYFISDHRIFWAEFEI